MLNRVLASRFEPRQGVDFNQSCGEPDGCSGELLGRLQPYALYVPAKAPPGGRYGLQLLLHSLGANYNQFSGSLTWRSAGVPPGFYAVRLRIKLSGGRVDERRFVVQKRGGRFIRRRGSARRGDCTLSRFALGSPVFGGTTARRLVVRYRTARTARVRADLVRRGKVVRRLSKSRRLRAGRTRILRVRPKALHRGAYRVRLTIRRSGAKPRRVALTARKL